MNALPALPAYPALSHALLEQYFNTHCREQGIATPPASKMDPAKLPPALQQRSREIRCTPFALPLRGGQRQLFGIVLQHSAIGWHRLDPDLWLLENERWQLLAEAAQLADLIADHLAASTADGSARERATRLKHAMRNSIAHAYRYQRPALAATCDFVRAEQSLRQGHVFHVTSKATEGFDDADLRRYAPELGARFRLHYFAVAPALYAATHATPADPAARAEATRLLQGQPAADWPLLPCHPWQAAHLLDQPAIALCLARGELVSLGPLGEVAIPTSSVRTVWLPAQACFLKLALDIRITNFVRNNPPEHVRRALDASRALAQLPRAAIDGPHFRVLLETGAQSLALDDAALLAGTTVLHREGLERAALSRFEVVAGVLEDADGGDSRLAQLLRQAGAGGAARSDLVRAWWRRYLDITLRPLLALLLDHGIGLEAHLQNSLVRFDDGWPGCALVRDMEGATVSRGSAAAAALPHDSAALYDEDEAWRRFQYYVLVNHLGQVAAMLARCTEVDEDVLWADLGACLAGTEHPRIAQLLQQPTLPAKANLLSSFAERGERPLYVAIPNPLRRTA